MASLSSLSLLPVTTISPQKEKKKKTGNIQKEKRQKERGTERKRETGFTLFCTLASLCQGRVTRAKRGERRETKEGVIFRNELRTERQMDERAKRTNRKGNI